MKLDHFYDKKTGSIKVFRIIVYIVLLAVVIGALNWGLGIVSMPFRQGKQLAEDVTNPKHVKYNYEWFYDQYQAIQATKNKIRTLKQRKKDLMVQLPEDSNKWNHEEKEKYEHITEASTGTINRYYDQVSKYNSRSRQLTRNIFKGKDLPKQIKSKEY